MYIHIHTCVYIYMYAPCSAHLVSKLIHNSSKDKGTDDKTHRREYRCSLQSWHEHEHSSQTAANMKQTCETNVPNMYHRKGHRTGVPTPSSLWGGRETCIECCRLGRGGFGNCFERI